MAKDPAFLFYPGDWQGGTMYFDHQTKGAYIDLMVLQFNVGRFTEAQAKQVLSICFSVAWAMLKQKFETDGEFYWNERLRLEIEKRQNFTKSRRDNALGEKKSKAYLIASAEHMHKHMEDENINENKDNNVVKKTKKDRAARPPKIMVAPDVNLTQEEHDKLLIVHGGEFMNKVYNWFANYKIEKSYKTKSDYLTITRWVIDAVNKQTNGANNHKQRPDPLAGFNASVEAARVAYEAVGDQQRSGGNLATEIYGPSIFQNGRGTAKRSDNGVNG